MNTRLIFSLFFALIFRVCMAQPESTGFTAPDTVCVGSTINITNNSTGVTTCYWNFCSGNANNNPSGINIGNPGNLLNVPTYITLVKQNNDCYSFISCQGVGVIRYYHGTSFINNPVSWTNLGQFGLLQTSEEGIQVKFDNGTWYGFVNNVTTLVRLNFGNSLANTPTAQDIGPFPALNMAHGLFITQEGTNWIGFSTCSTGQKLVRFNFGNSLANIPVVTDFGSFGGILISPSALCFVNENGLWYALIMAGGNTLARITFGNSLLNTPTGVSLGNPGGFNAAGGLTLLRDCESTTGYWTNYIVNGELGKLTFPSGISGPAIGTILGNIGGLARPHSFSEIFRENDDLYAYITNRDNGTLTRLTFPHCTNASVPSSSLFTPPPFSYNQTGTYNIHLITDEGLVTAASLCKPVVVVNPPTINLGNNMSICQGSSTILNAGPNFSSYAWSTGATTQTITVTSAGTYTVTATRWGCSATDNISVAVSSSPAVNLGPDTTICAGNTITFDAGFCNGCSYQWGNLTTGQPNIGTGQTYTTNMSSIYEVTVTNGTGCVGRDTVQLFLDPLTLNTVGIGTDSNPVCSGTQTIFYTTFASNPGTSPVYQWFVNGNPVGTNFPIYQYIPADGDNVQCRLLSSAQCMTINPAYSNIIHVVVNPTSTVTVSINASENPVCPGNSVTYYAVSTNGGTNPVYKWFVNGTIVGTNSSTYNYNPLNGDQVSCQVSSNENCPLNNPAISNTITMTVNPSQPVSVTINASANPVCSGTPITFTATPANGGMSPSYQWFVNNSSVGTNNSTYTYIPNNGDLVCCKLTSSETCTTNNPASSIQHPVSVNQNPLVTFTPCFDTITTDNAKPFKLKGGLPLGGTYSGPGVTTATSTFSPSAAGFGSNTITYSYTNAGSCSKSAFATIVTRHASPLTCGNPITDPRDNQVYPTTLIGTQCWMAANLNHGKSIDKFASQTDNCIPEKYCFNNSAANCLEYGGLYQWDELMRYEDAPAEQGICLPGWHIPTENEWSTLFNFYTSNALAAYPLRHRDFSGFIALMAGIHHMNINADYQDFATFFWSSDAAGKAKARTHGMNWYDNSVSLYSASRANAFSVRCLKD